LGCAFVGVRDKFRRGNFSREKEDFFLNSLK